MAQKTQGTSFSVASAAGSPKTITAATAATPVQITSAGHGLANGTVVIISGVVGMVQLNGRAFVVANTAANTFELKGEDGTNYTAYASGGVATPQTMVAIGECAGIGPGFTGEATEIDITHLLSVAKEKMLGLQDFGDLPFTVFVPSAADTGQTRLRFLKKNAVSAAFLISLPSGQVASFVAFVKSFPFSALSPDSAFQGSPNLLLANAPGCEFV